MYLPDPLPKCPPWFRSAESRFTAWFLGCIWLVVVSKFSCKKNNRETQFVYITTRRAEENINIQEPPPPPNP